LIKTSHFPKKLFFFVFSMNFIALLIISESWGRPSAYATVKSGFPVDVVGNGYSSPNLVDLDSDGQLEIVIGTSAGYVYVINSAGKILAQYNTAVPIESSPSVADINNDGQLEIVVSTGGYACDFSCHAAVYAFDKDLNVLSGWPQYSIDFYGSGYNPGFFSTPALGDLDKDGDLEIVVAGFDQYIHVWHHDGTYMTNWPRWCYETLSSSPALADIDKDGFLEVIIGVEAHEWNPIWPPGEEKPDTPTLDGGYIYVLDRFANNKSGFPQYIDQIIQSSPAIGDINDDGYLEIVVGTGVFYPGVGYGIYAFDKDGDQLWKATTGGYVFSSPALGDIDGDGGLDVAIWSQDGNIYALDGKTGSSLAGWPVQGKDGWGNTYNSQNISPTLADYDGDGLADIFLTLGWEVVIVKSDGSFITNDGNHDNDPDHPSFYANGTTVPCIPATGDIDGDHLLDVITGSLSVDTGQGKVYAWETGKTLSTLPWPMFRKNASHTGLYGEIQVNESLVRDFVTRFYEQCLGRSPDQTGLNGWVSDLASWSRTGADVAQGFVFSQEFINQDTNDQEYLTVLYTAFFNRAPDAGGLSGWLNQMQNGASRAAVLEGFIYAQEFINLCNNYGIIAFNARNLVEAFVTRFYRQCLSRDPDAAGLSGWVNNLLSGSMTGSDLAQSFVFSPEFLNRGTTNEAYLRVLYTAFFNREPDAASLNLWLEEMNNGMSRETVLNGFTGAQEFIDLCGEYGITP
jgi:hypothetical protein